MFTVNHVLLGKTGQDDDEKTDEIILHVVSKKTPPKY